MFSERDHKLEKSTENLCLCDAIQFRQFDSLFSFSESTFANVWKLFSENTESEREMVLGRGFCFVTVTGMLICGSHVSRLS